jgi:hypothetical protein
MDLTQLTDLMDELARQTWFNLKTARRLSMRMGEVTVTEVNPLAMSRLLDAQGIPAELIPTRADESTTGVDFEIWLDVNGARFFGYSIQAKIVAVRGNKFSYPQLSHHDRTENFNTNFSKTMRDRMDHGRYICSSTGGKTGRLARPDFRLDRRSPTTDAQL